MATKTLTSTDPAAELLAQFPDYAQTTLLDDLRRTDYARLDIHDHAYLDYTGGGMYAELAGPRSRRPHHVANLREPALRQSDIRGIDHARRTRAPQGARVLPRDRLHRGLHAQRERGAEAHRREFPVHRGKPVRARVRQSQLGERHPRVRASQRSGVRATRRSPCRICASIVPSLDTLLGRIDRSVPNLFAFPAQSNFSGVKHPLALVDRAHEQRMVRPARRSGVRTDQQARPHRRHSPISSRSRSTRCSATPPASAVCWCTSEALPLLHRPWFAGGTVNFATVQGRAHILSPGEAGFEDGTLNYSQHPRDRDRPAASRTDRHRDDPDTRPGSDRLAAPQAVRPAPRERPAHGPHLRTDNDRTRVGRR
ncbi:MAG: hypothetical protein QM736_04435 [Vicinamibacterales bacterium]